MRCNLMSWNLVQWNLAMIVAPEEINIDFFDLICVRGGSLFRVFTTPNGIMTIEKIYKNWTSKKKKYLTPWMRQMLALEIRLRHFFRFGKSDMRRNKEDMGKTRF